MARTATPAINRGKCRHVVALSEFEQPVLNGLQRSVNRKVRGSNPRSGANLVCHVADVRAWYEERVTAA